MFLFSLELRFVKDAAARGGPGFVSRFADNGVLLGNGVAPLVPRVAIEKSTTWSPKSYQLTWTPVGAVMDPSGDIGYNWSNYVGHSKGANENLVVTSGRFGTIWRKEPDGSWKVVLDAGVDAPVSSGDCCRVSTANYGRISPFAPVPGAPWPTCIFFSKRCITHCAQSPQVSTSVQRYLDPMSKQARCALFHFLRLRFFRNIQHNPPSKKQDYVGGSLPVLKFPSLCES